MQEKQGRFIILKKIKFGESDLIIHALGTNGSKYAFMARAALKSKKRFGGGILEPLHFVNLSYKEHDDHEKIKKLNEASLIDDFKNLHSSYDKIELALFILKCVTPISQVGDVNSDFLFNLTGNSLRAICKLEDTNLESLLRIIKLQFCLKLLFQQGVIAVESWMSEFLKNNMEESQNLISNPTVLESTENYLDSMESLVLQYIKTADTGFE